MLEWTGRPRQGIYLRSSDLLGIPFSLMWGGFSIFWESMAIRSGNGFMILWGIPFVCIGLYMIAGRFFWDAYLRNNTSYALTRDRALFVRGGLKPKMLSVYLPTVASINLTAQPDGTGTITFGDVDKSNVFSDPFNTRKTVPEFESIINAADVYRKCLAAQSGRQQTAPAAPR